jgi:hypothetical protein
LCAPQARRVNSSHRIAILLTLSAIAPLGCESPNATPDAFSEVPDASTSTSDAVAFDARSDADALDANADAGAGDDAGSESDASVDAGAESDAGNDAGTDAGSDAGNDAGTDAGSDAGRDAGNDAGNDAGRDAGNDAGRDAGNDAGRDAYTPPDPCSPLPSGLTTQVINDSASSGTPDTYMYNVNPGDPFCASITGGGSDPWQVIVSNGFSSGIYCSGDPTCSIFVPAGQTRIFVTATNEGSPASYRLTIHYIPRI